ncbi:NtaA/DmoA family FMN-dependent monooxygenase [Microlunatus soli]|uniref:FMN-dependent oxidoreductase, nitrilotriacetate monooxygenase family n=1 Tax=Microlunatus soli TaxID=630515 RepID=A0A1H1PJQ6_9ACTN|nr:NtaA/DmoA family FMN-dependent monooxygenase [Microlunatus soli]SDS11491.1 FMN-dependent oxidoreductase, nitrilotriacetate monooxygenase family [Microlunatus soli]
MSQSQDHRQAGRPTKQVRLGAHFPGVNHNTVWSDPQAGSHIAFGSFRELAQSAERGRFDFFFLAEGLRLRERHGKIHDLDVVGRPDTLPVLAALAAVTEHLGLVGTINATFNEPYELARQFASLDLLSDGRAGWNVVTSSDAFTGENFRRGGYLARTDRYVRAADSVGTARELWDSWQADAVVADLDHFTRPGAISPFSHHSEQFDISGVFDTPRPVQGHPVIFQAGDSADGRDFGARTADAIFGRWFDTAERRRTSYADFKQRAASFGRQPEELKIFPGVSFALGDTEEEAQHNDYRIRRAQITPQTALNLLGQVWNRDLSDLDPDGPLPTVDPDRGGPSVVAGQSRRNDEDGLADRYRTLAREKGLSIRELMIEVQASRTFVGTPRQVARQLADAVADEQADGFILVPHLTPSGLDGFVDTVVPELQDLGAYRTDYEGGTLRENLGLPEAGRQPIADPLSHRAAS